METINGFIGGLDRDLAYLKYPNNKYYSMENFRVTTSEGLSTGAIENEKGNKLDFIIPNTTQVIKLYLDPIPLGEFRSFRINNFQFIVNDSATLQSIFTLVSNSSNFDIGVDFNMYLSEDYILFFGLDNFDFTSNIPGQEMNFIELVPAITNHKIIHMDHFNDKVVVFTTSNTLLTTNADGQIWLLDYNEETNTVNNLNGNELIPSIHLKYNNQLNLSTAKYIRKSITRYENLKTARVYWTDFYNPVRSFNLLDPEGYALDPSDLDFVSSVNFTKPQILSIDSNGAIPTGSVVQFFYQLVAGGKETIYSPGSDLLPLYEADSTTESFVGIEGTPQGGTADKSVTYRVSNIDPDYEFIRHIAVLYEFNNLPIILQFKEESIPSSREVNVTFTNTEESIPITEQELNILNSQFNICKDLTHKDNRLIAVNTKSTKFEITDDEFDSRAYRFNSSQACNILDKDSNVLIVDNTFNVPFTHDAINPFNDNDNLFFAEYKYKSDGITLGGEGPNISYEFITRQVITDERGLAGQLNWAGISGNNRTEVVEGNNVYENQFRHFKSPYVHMLYGGYMRDEVYRFAIVFRDLKGNVSFAKWIGDIRFPDVYEYPLEQILDGKLQSNQLGIQFNINIPNSIKDKISGYEIVRVERDSTNRTRIAGGLFAGVVLDGSNLRGVDLLSPDNTFYNGTSSRNIFSFISPWFQFRQLTNPDFKADDYIQFHYWRDTAFGFSSPNFGLSNSWSGTNGFLSYAKLRLTQFTYDYKVELKNFRYVGRDSSFNINNNLDNTSPYNTYFSTVGLNNTKSCPHYMLAADNGITLPTNNMCLYGTYCRKLAKQYGGNTYEERSSNRYISTGMFVEANDSTTTDIFGGDTYCNYFDFEYTQNNDGASVPDKEVSGIIFTCESPFNVDLRHGKHFAEDRYHPDESEYLDYTAEQYYYNPVYLQQNTAKQTYIAKPFNVNLEDEQPYAIWVSELKVNGEQIDSWVKFKINNQIEVDGIYGPINAVINHKGRVYFLQNEATGIVPINERVVTTNQDGIELSLGTGDVISVYGYISTKTGCFHTSSVVQSEDYFYFFDNRSKKFYRMSQDSKEPLSDLKGMSAYFNSFVKESLLETEDNKTDLIPTGIHGTYDPRYNRILFTFYKGDAFTLSFNEYLGGFESFYSFKPCVYLSTGRKILTVDGRPFISNRKAVYQHDTGNYGEFYGETHDSKLTLCVNGQNGNTKEWNNLSWYSECYNNLNDVPDETFTSIRVYNDHQTTGDIVFGSNNLQRRFRYWKHAIKRDLFSYQQRARIRNPWVLIELTKQNTNNNRFVCHDITSYYLL